MNPRITLITVCYNIETTIAKVLQSARAFKQVQSGAVLIVYCARWAGRERCISLKSQRVVQGGRRRGAAPINLKVSRQEDRYVSNA